jgi:hypothetical protein
MIGVKGNNKRGASVVFYKQLVDDQIASKVSSALSSASADISATSLTLTGTTGMNVRLPSTYQITPPSGYLGYMYSIPKTTNVNVSAATVTIIHSIVIPQGVWLLSGTAIYTVSGNMNWFQLGISLTSGFDDYTSVIQHVVTTTSGTGMITPTSQRYYCSNANTTTVSLILYINGCAATVQPTTGPTHTTLRALRIA